MTSLLLLTDGLQPIEDRHTVGTECSLHKEKNTLNKRIYRKD